MRVANIGSNQTLVTYDNGTQILVSYETPVAAFVPGRGYFRTNVKHSETTSKHVNAWINGVNACSLVSQGTIEHALNHGEVIPQKGE